MLDEYPVFAYAFGMDEMPAELWIAACAHRLQRQWRTVDPEQLEEVAGDLWRDERLRAMAPDVAAVEWLRPITSDLAPPNGAARFSKPYREPTPRTPP